MNGSEMRHAKISAHLAGFIVSFQRPGRFFLEASYRTQKGRCRRRCQSLGGFRLWDDFRRRARRRCRRRLEDGGAPVVKSASQVPRTEGVQQRVKPFNTKNSEKT